MQGCGNRMRISCALPEHTPRLSGIQEAGVGGSDPEALLVKETEPHLSLHGFADQMLATNRRVSSQSGARILGSGSARPVS